MSTWSHRGGGPFSGPYNATTSESWPGARWGHKENDREPESEPESEPKSEPEQERPPIFGIFGLGVGQPKRPRPRRQLPPGPVPIYLIPTPTVRNPEASRPYDQFLYQITKERDWIKDETDYKQPGSAIDLDAVAYQGVKKNWIKNGIWNPKWDDLPGRTWIYEEPEEEVVVEAPAASDDSGRRPSDTADDRQQTHGPRHPSLFRPAPIPEVTNGRTDGGPTRAPGGAEASNAEGRPSGRTRESSSRQLTVTHGTQDPEQPPRRSLRSARPSQAETGGSSAATVRSQVQTHPSARPAEMPKKSSTKGRLNRSRGDDLNKQTSKSQRLSISEDLSPSERSVSPLPRVNPSAVAAPMQSSTNSLRNGRGITLDTRFSRPIMHPIRTKNHTTPRLSLQRVQHRHVMKWRRPRAGEPEGKESQLFPIHFAAAPGLRREKGNSRPTFRRSCNVDDQVLRQPRLQQPRLQREAAQDEAISMTYRRRREMEEKEPILLGQRPGSRTKAGNIQELLARYFRVLEAESLMDQEECFLLYSSKGQG